MKKRSRRMFLRLLTVTILVLMLGFSPGSFLYDGKLWAQEEDEDEEEKDPPAEALSRAKRTLQEMGIRLADSLGRVGNVRDMQFAFSAKISDSQKALDNGFGLAEPRPTPLKNGTTLSVVIDAKGKVTFFVDSQNKLKDSKNGSTSIAIDKNAVPNAVAVSSSSFPSTIK